MPGRDGTGANGMVGRFCLWIEGLPPDGPSAPLLPIGAGGTLFHCAEIVCAPGAVVPNLAPCLELFASAIADPDGADAAAARGATAYAASAWSADIGWAPGTLGAVDPPRQRGTSSDPAAVSGDRRAASDHGAGR